MSSRTAWTPIGWSLMAYALLYPAINAVEHGSVLKVPTFGLPCPTTIFTAGLLLLAAPHSRPLAIVPVVWSVIGGSAAFLFGVSADYALPVAGVALAGFELQNRGRHQRTRFLLLSSMSRSRSLSGSQGGSRLRDSSWGRAK